ncbi:hypothetical protein [Crossiella cryophila]|uniref:DUF2637 domain-containing protein n=1 Tax=Crossiella cryophila TaxID=43355 RepID=A0A7W7FWD1_9PSEU|nr:hypothetical protein [Crossiella cryophila]
MNAADQLLHDAREASRIRAHQTHPDVIALQVERIRTQVDRLMWTGIVLGLAFTMANVQHFAAAGAPQFSLPWLTAWLLDPMVSLVLIAILRAEQIIAQHRLRTGPWVRRAKWATLAATYAMNTWSAWANGDGKAVLLHSVPPLLIFLAAEAITDLRDKLTAAVTRACVTAATPSNPEFTTTSTGAVNTSTTKSMNTTATVREQPAAGVHERQGGANKAPTRARIRFADYLARAQQALTADTVITPAWVRQVTDCSRGLSSQLAAALNNGTSAGANGPTAPPVNTAASRPVNTTSGQAVAS